jgi:CheY-like chemotaxis protein
MAERGLRSLVVDPDAQAARGVVSLLRDRVGPASACPDAYMAFARLKEEVFDALVLEVALPGASGVDLLERIDGEIPAVVVTSLYSAVTVARARAAGARAVLGKPFDPDTLVYSVLEAVEPSVLISRIAPVA